MSNDLRTSFYTRQFPHPRAFTQSNCYITFDTKRIFSTKAFAPGITSTPGSFFTRGPDTALTPTRSNQLLPNRFYTKQIQYATGVGRPRDSAPAVELSQIPLTAKNARSLDLLGYRVFHGKAIIYRNLAGVLILQAGCNLLLAV